MSVAATTLPVLESGDCLTRDPFHHRYCARLDLKKGELVEGVVYVPPPVRADFHGEPHVCAAAWLGTNRATSAALRLFLDTTVRLGVANAVQPDACLLRDEPGGPRVNALGYVEGAPRLVVETAASSASYDLHDKKEAYRRNGVREYVVWRVLDRALDQFRLEAGEYVPVLPDEQEHIASVGFPGLRLDIPKLLAGDLAGVLAALP